MPAPATLCSWRHRMSYPRQVRSFMKWYTTYLTAQTYEDQHNIVFDGCVRVSQVLVGVSTANIHAGTTSGATGSWAT